MNPNTISTITTVLGMINPAIGVITSLVASFGKGDMAAKFDKASGKMQDAAGVITSLMPLVKQFAEGNDVTPEDVRAALFDMDSALSEFDKLIKAKGG